MIDRTYLKRYYHTLSRRLNFLEERRDHFGKCNSYDKAEIAALRFVTQKLKERMGE